MSVINSVAPMKTIWSGLRSADAQPGEQWIATHGKRPNLPDGAKLFAMFVDGSGNRIQWTVSDCEPGWRDVTHYRLASGQSNAPVCNCGGESDYGQHGVCCNISLARKPAAAPVWRPCSERPTKIDVYLRKKPRGKREHEIWHWWNGEFWGGSCAGQNAKQAAQSEYWKTYRSDDNFGEWLDPAPGHEEQVQSIGHDIDPYSDTCSRCSKHRSEILAKCSFYCTPHREQVNAAQEPEDKQRYRVRDEAPAAAPTIEQDRQAWRSWFGAYSEPVKPFGSRG